MSTGTGFDSLRLMFTGGASNREPDACLGGRASARRVRGCGFVVSNDKLSALRIDDVSAACGFGVASFATDADGDLIFTPPILESTDAAGDPVTVASGDEAVVASASAIKAALVYRSPDFSFPRGRSLDLKLVEIMNGPLAQRNVESAERVAGLTTYRAIMLYAPSSIGNVRLWTPGVLDAQSTFYLGTEDPDSSGVAIQTIANETTAPSGVVFVHATDEASAVTIPAIAAGDYVGLWIKRAFPAAGVVAPIEHFDLSVEWEE